MKWQYYLGEIRFLIANVFAKNSHIVWPVQGSRMKLRLTDIGISNELIKRGLHESWTTKLVREEVKPGMNIIEIGANIGYYTLIEAQIVGNTSEIHCIEPLPGNIELLQENLNLNSVKNASIYQCAISNYSGTAKFQVMKASNWGCLSPSNKEMYSNFTKKKSEELVETSINVQVLTFTDFITQNKINKVSFVRMDSEGHEIQIIEGMSEFLNRTNYPMKILIELHNKHFANPKKEFSKMLDILIKAGFSCKRFYAKGDVYENIINEQLLNVVCKKNDICSHLLMTRY